MTAELDGLVDGLRSALREQLVAVYLHGSLALRCFNPNRSDVDLLIVTERRLAAEERDAALDVLRAHTGTYDRAGWPRPLEVSTLARADLHPWRHPCPYDLHFATSFPFGTGPGVDPDLAAHVWVTRRHGVALHGPPPADVLPDVPDADYLDSIMGDFESCVGEGHEWPRYALLSMSRVWACLATGEFHTKESGTAWALDHTPAELRPLPERALASYRGDGRDFDVDPDAFARYAAFVASQVR